MKKVLIIVGDASETLDTLYPFYRLQEGGYEPVVAGPEKKTYQMVMHEVKPGWTITKEWKDIQSRWMSFAEVKEEEYLGILFQAAGHRSISVRPGSGAHYPAFLR